MKYVLVVDHLTDSIPAALNKLVDQGVIDPVGVLFLTRRPEVYANVAMDGVPLKTLTCTFQDDDLQDIMPQYTDDVIAVICRGDKQVQFLRKLLPYLPSRVHVSSDTSLDAATNKRLMREAFALSAPEITPIHTRVYDASVDSVRTIESTVGYPVIVKPASLVSSLLIQKCRNRQSLQAALNTVFDAIQSIYTREDRASVPEVIAEEYLEGDFYSIDAYVRAPDQVTFCPPVAYIPAQQIGIDDFFLYKRFVPTDLTDQDIRNANEATKKAITALGLTYTSTHVELIKTVSGWKIIEVGPRLGRFRNTMYELAYGIDHSLNDILTHLDRSTVIPTELQRYCAAYSIYPHKEGILQQIQGVDYLQQNPHVSNLKIAAKTGDMAHFAKNGGKALAEFIVTATDEDDFASLDDYIRENVKAIIES